MKNTIDHYHINNFVKNHVIDNILVIESQDPQFIAISNIYHQLKSDYPDDISQNNILLIDLVTKISLISYQIGGTGEQRRTDVMEYIYNNWSDISLQQINDNDWRNELLQNTKYNRRLKNMKLARLAKIGNLREIFIDLKSYEIAYYDMNIYYQNLNNKLGSDIYAKTPLFATKMFGYICRLVFGRLVLYPDGLSIPLDSRLKQIYISIHQDDKIDNKIVIKYFDELAYNNKISPLHLDSLLWLKYWDLVNN